MERPRTLAVSLFTLFMADFGLRSHPTPLFPLERENPCIILIDSERWLIEHRLLFLFLTLPVSRMAATDIKEWSGKRCKQELLRGSSCVLKIFTFNFFN